MDSVPGLGPDLRELKHEASLRKELQEARRPPAQPLSSQLSGWRWLRVLSKHLLRGRRMLRPSHWPSSSLFVAPWGSQAPKNIQTQIRVWQFLGNALMGCIDLLENNDP